MPAALQPVWRHSPDVCQESGGFCGVNGPADAPVLTAIVAASGEILGAAAGLPAVCLAEAAAGSLSALALSLGVEAPPFPLTRACLEEAGRVLRPEGRLLVLGKGASWRAREAQAFTTVLELFAGNAGFINFQRLPGLAEEQARQFGLSATIRAEVFFSGTGATCRGARPWETPPSDSAFPRTPPRLETARKDLCGAGLWRMARRAGAGLLAFTLAHPTFRRRLTRLLQGLGVYGPLRSLYWRLSRWSPGEGAVGTTLASSREALPQAARCLFEVLACRSQERGKGR